MAFKDRFKDTEPLAVDIETVQTIVQEPVKFSFSDDIKRQFSVKLSAVPVWFEYSEEDKMSLIETFIANYINESKISLSPNEQNSLKDKLLKNSYGFGELDMLLSDDTISTIFIKENSHVKIEHNGIISQCDVKIQSVRDLCDKLCKVSGASFNKNVSKFGFRNLIVTVLKPPVCPYMIVIKKKNRKVTTFDYLEKNGFINKNIREFLGSLLNDKKKILVIGNSESGKTSYLEAFLESISDSLLLQENKNIDRESFICAGLSNDEFDNLITVVENLDSNYVVCDFNDGFFGIEKTPLISTLRADSVASAVSKLAGMFAAKDKLSEKHAKAAIVSKFDYIIQLNAMNISSLVELSLNKAWSLVISEAETDDNTNDEEISDLVEEQEISAPVLDNTFTSRFR